MKITIIVDPEMEENHVEIHTREVTEEINRISELMQKHTPVITGTDEYDRIVIINEESIIALHAEKKWCRINTSDSSYSCRKRLYEIESILGNHFMRISKSIIVNLKMIESVEAVFNGMLLLRMKNGTKEYVSRTYLQRMKDYLGI